MLHRSLVHASFAVLATVSISSAAPAAPFLDPKLPVDKRVADLIGRATLEEKASLLNHKGKTVTVAGHPIRADQWNQCLNGVQWNRPTTLFPTCVAMAATWDPDFVRDEIARVLSDEARAIYNGWHLDRNAAGEHKGLIYRAPVINIERNPYWGRNHEAFGEDPFLTGRMAVAYVKGIQGDHPNYLKLAATLKHYAVNNVETDRFKLNAKVSDRMLREYWLPHFRDAVVEGGACSLMASYNAINDVPNNINRWLLTDVLKDEWGHQGFVVSDLGGVRTMVEGHEEGTMTYADAVAKSLMAGCDFSDREFEEHIPEAVRTGKLSQERLDDALARVLRVRFRLGEFDAFGSVPFSRISPEVIGSTANRTVALEAARKSIVLLQNRDKVLPLDETSIKSIAVVGPLADRVVTNNYNGSHGATVSVLEGIRRQVGYGVEVTHAAGTGIRGDIDGPASKVDLTEEFHGGSSVKFEARAAGQHIEFTVAVREEGTYRVGLDYKSFPERGIFQLSIDGRDLGEPVDMFHPQGRHRVRAAFGERRLAAGAHTFRFTVVGKSDASSGFSGHFDRLTLAGPKTLEIELEGAPYVLGIADQGPADGFAKAVELARAADVAVVVVGTDDTVEHEGLDRTSLALTGRQEELVKQVLAANPRTVVVQMSAGPLTVPWLKKNVPAMLQAWWAGGEGGHAVADVLFGKVNPGGRLPHTVYASEEQVPSLDEYDISKGFTYMYVKGEPLYAFGHGLSYTSFGYQPLQATPEISPDGNLTASVSVRNTGGRRGDEVVQLYVRAVDSKVTRPARELRGFQRITLSPGEEQTVNFTVPAAKLAYYDEGAKSFVVEPGEYEIMVGAASDDIRQRATVRVK